MRNQCPLCRAIIPFAVPLAARNCAQPPQQQRSFWDYVVEIFCFVPFVMTFLGLFTLVQLVAPYVDLFTWLEWFANAVFWPHYNVDTYSATQWGEQPNESMMTMIPFNMSAANASTFCSHFYDAWMRRNYM